jgi:hypothetical protein
MTTRSDCLQIVGGARTGTAPASAAVAAFPRMDPAASLPGARSSISATRR